jgi:tetratricopeptide (TPR) repeat protein
VADSSGVQEISRLLERGLARYQAGDLVAAAAEWGRALRMAPENEQVKALVAFVRAELGRSASSAPGAASGPLEAEEEPEEMAFSDDWEADQDTNPELAHETLERVLRAERDAVESEKSRRWRKTLISPIPAILSRLTDPSWSPSKILQDDAAAARPAEQRGSSVGQAEGEPPELQLRTGDLEAVVVDLEETKEPLPEAAGAAWAAIEDLVDLAQAAMEEGRREDAVITAERALGVLGDAGSRGLPAEARTTFERIFEAYLGSMKSRPVRTSASAPAGLDARRAAFLGRINGSVPTAALLTASGMPRLEALRALAAFVRAGLIRMD